MNIIPDLIDELKLNAISWHPNGIKLSSGLESNYYVDTSQALGYGPNLVNAARAILYVADQIGLKYNHVGGLTMGADALAHAIAMQTDRFWFSVRKEPKGENGTDWFDGVVPGEGDNVLIVDDVVTTGNSIAKAVNAVFKSRVVGIIPLVDRGMIARKKFAHLVYEPVITWKSLDIPPIKEN